MFKIINPEGWKKAKGYSNGTSSAAKSDVMLLL